MADKKDAKISADKVVAKAVAKAKKAAAPKKKKEKKKIDKKDGGKYVAAVGRRKEAVARTRYYLKGKGDIVINGMKMEEYFPYFELQSIVQAPLELTGMGKASEVSITIKGGGKKGQAEAARLGIARCLLKIDPELRKTVKPAGFLTRDARVKERKKPGLKRARRAPQFSKR